MTDQHDTERPAAIQSDVQFVGTPESLGELFAALAAAQGEFQPIVKDSTASVQMKAGGSYKFDYAGLDVVIAATQPALSKHGLAFMQLLTESTVHTVLAKGGARIESVIGFQGCANAQEFGSKVTYLKRYARLSILSVFPQDEDDDANTSMGNKADIAKRTPPEPKAPPPTNANVAVETKKTIGDLAKRLGWANKDLEGFSEDHGCGKLAALNDAKAGALVKLLEAAVAANAQPAAQ
jgi:hypothetical protein